jgi:5'-phosphate synthase pdxT subunit
MTIGILAVQGDFALHDKMLRQLDVETLLVRTKEMVNACHGLILPGGESTTLTNLLKKHGLWDELSAFAETRPIFGTCAGLIILAKRVVKNNLQPLGLIDISVERNAYGRQIDSFIDDITLHLDKQEQCEGVFIRAPKIVAIGKSVMPLAWHKQDIVLVESDHILAGTFHPELTDNPKIHQYFIAKIKKNMLNIV